MRKRKERRTAKKPINAYLFLLAKRLAQACLFGAQNPTDLQFVKAIYDRYKSTNFINTTYIDGATRKVKNDDVVILEKVKLDPFAMGIARRLHKILKTKDLCFTESMLDYLVKEISYRETFSAKLFRPFETWLDFANFFQNDRGVLVAAELCKNRTYDELLTSEKRKIQDAVEIKLIKFLTRDRKNGHGVDFLNGAYIESFEEKITIIVTNDSYTIRTTFPAEVFEFHHRLSGKFQASFVEKAKGWLSTNKDTIYIYKDEFGIEGYISLLPVTKIWYEELLTGGKFTKSVLSSDIIRTTDTHQIKFVLIEAIEGLSNRAKALLKFHLPQMLEALVKDNNQDFTLLYLAKDGEVTDIIQRYAFIDYCTLYGENIRDTKTVYLANGKTVLGLIGK